MRNRKIFICAAITALLVTGCGKSAEEPVETTLPVKVAVTQLQTTTTTTTAPPEVVKELTPYEKTDFAFSEIENNIDDTVDLSLVQVNGKWLSINSMKLEEFIRGAGIKKCSWSTVSNADEKLYFVGNGYGIDATESPDKYTLADPTSFNGTLIGIECELKGEAVEIIDTDKIGEYRIKAVTSSRDNTKDDYEISYYGGIKVGMTRKEVLEVLGNRAVVKNEVTIASTTTTTTTTTTPVPTETVPPETEAPVPTETSVVTTVPTEVPAVEETTSESIKIVKVESPKAEATVSTTAEKVKKKKGETEASLPSEKEDETETEVTTVPAYTVTDEEGNAVTAEDGTPITETYVTDENGSIVTTEETTVTTVPPVDEFEANYTGDLYFKNTKNTLVIVIRQGVVTQIFLYNNKDISK